MNCNATLVLLCHVHFLGLALLQANYQLILPDIEKYLGHIGASSSWAGIAIGCCDVATLPGALGYSLWTNKSFKAPLLAAALACICGNVLYGAGYDAKALWILLASRLLVGFGKLKAIALLLNSVQTQPLVIVPLAMLCLFNAMPCLLLMDVAMSQQGHLVHC